MARKIRTSQGLKGRKTHGETPFEDCAAKWTSQGSISGRKKRVLNNSKETLHRKKTRRRTHQPEDDPIRH